MTLLGQLSLKGRALRLLSGREHSRTEIERKLASHETEAGQLKAILDELEARGFIDEQRVVDSVVHRRAGKLGAARIHRELQGKGLDGDATQQAVAQLQASEFERAREVWRKKFGSAPASAAERGRQMRFLASRGFGSEVMRRVIENRED